MDPRAKKPRVTYGEALEKRKEDFKGSNLETAMWVVEEFLQEFQADQVTKHSLNDTQLDIGTEGLRDRWDYGRAHPLIKMLVASKNCKTDSL